MADTTDEPTRDSELILKDGRIYHLRLEQDDLARNLIYVGDPARVDKVAGFLDSPGKKVKNREYVTRSGTYRGVEVSVIGTGIGTDNSEIGLVESYGVAEIDFKTRLRRKAPMKYNIVRVGTCGGLQKDVPVGTIAITKFALGLDNTGLWYEQPLENKTCKRLEKAAYRLITDATPAGRRFRGKIFPYVSAASPELTRALVHHASWLDPTGYVAGITASSSGFFGPQGREVPGIPITVPGLQAHLAGLCVDGYRVYNMEMESSLLCHLGALLGYRVGSVCAIIANRPAGTFLKDYSKPVARAIETALEALVEMDQK